MITISELIGMALLGRLILGPFNPIYLSSEVNRAGSPFGRQSTIPRSQ